MNVNALKEAQDQLKTGGGGSEGFMNTKILTAEGIPVRILPEPPELNGIFHFEVTKFWVPVDGKRVPLICQSTFAKKSVIQEELDEALQSDDEDVVGLASDTDNKTGCSKAIERWMALLQLNYELDKHGNIKKVTVVDDRAKVFQCGKDTLTSAIVKEMTKRQALALARENNAPDGSLDRVYGYNVLLSKTGAQKLTRYAAALDEQMEMDAKYYVNIPNVMEIARAQCKTGAYQRAAIRNYLYGEEIPKEVQAKEDARAEKAKEIMKQLTPPVAVSDAVAKKKKVADDDDEDTAPPKKKVVAPAPKKKAIVDDDEEDEAPKSKPKKKQIIDDDDDPEEEEDAPPPPKKKAKPIIEDEDEDDDAPIPVKKAAPKKKAIIDDDDEEDETPKPKKKAAATPPAPAKKSAAKRSILDDIDDDDED